MNFGIASINLPSQNALGPFHRMSMDVDESREYCVLLKIHYMSPRAGTAFHFRVIADREHCAIAHRKSGHNARLRFQGDDVPVTQNQVRIRA